MFYATIDYSNKKSFFKKYSAEEVLGEVKICVPKTCSQKHLTKNVIKGIKKYNVQNVVLSEKISNIKDLKMALLDNKKIIITGNRMSKILLPKILEEVSKYSNYQEEKMKVVLLMNEYSIENIDLIECISKSVKQLTVVSNNYKKYEKTSQRLLKDYGYMVKLYDDDFMDCRRENVIVNIDFKEDDFKKLNINRQSIIISLNEKIIDFKKNFLRNNNKRFRYNRARNSKKQF